MVQRRQVVQRGGVVGVPLAQGRTAKLHRLLVERLRLGVRPGLVQVVRLSEVVEGRPASAIFSARRISDRPDISGACGGNIRREQPAARLRREVSLSIQPGRPGRGAEFALRVRAPFHAGSAAEPALDGGRSARPCGSRQSARRGARPGRVGGRSRSVPRGRGARGSGGPAG